jgi:ABC-2 type transport system permease protein
VNPSFGTQVLALSRRSIARSIRQPVLVIPSILFPLFMLAIFAGSGGQITKVDGFPTKSYITFVLGATLIQGASGAMNTAGNAIAEDIDSGFLNRLALTRMRGALLISAQLAGIAFLGTIQGAVTLLVGLAAGAHLKAGVAGGIVLVALITLIFLAFGAVGVLVAIRTGSASQVQGLTAIGLGLLFLSSMVMPRNLITKDWFKQIATYNPVSYLVEASRSLLIDGWNREALLLGVGVAVATLVIGVAAASVTLHGKVART